MRFSLDIDLSTLFIFYISHLLSHFFHFLEGRSEPVHSAKKGMDSLDETYSLTLSRFLMRPSFPTPQCLASSSTQSSSPHRRSPSKGFPRTPSTMTPHSRMCCVKLTEYMSITLNEKTYLSVGQSSSVSERTGRFVGERAERPAESSSQDAQIGTLLDRQKERILAECQAGINRHEFQADYDRRSLRINSFFMDSYCSKIWNYVKVSVK